MFEAAHDEKASMGAAFGPPSRRASETEAIEIPVLKIESRATRGTHPQTLASRLRSLFPYQMIGGPGSRPRTDGLHDAARLLDRC
jgi:hypothetical protein